MPRHVRKRCRQEDSQKSIFGSLWPPQTSPKSLQKRFGTRTNGVSKEACFATLCNSPGSRRKSTEVVVCKPSKWLGIWLGLLHPSIHPSIRWSAPRRPNHQSKFFNLRSIEQNKSQPYGPQPPKSTKNPFKIHPKSCQNPSQTHLRRKMRPRHVSKSTCWSSWTIFSKFWRAQGLPKSSQNH